LQLVTVKQDLHHQEPHASKKKKKKRWNHKAAAPDHLTVLKLLIKLQNIRLVVKVFQAISLDIWRRVSKTLLEFILFDYKALVI
jgi:hypothetical protein